MKAIATFLKKFKAPDMNILFITKIKIFEFVKWSYRLPPPSMLTIECKMINMFGDMFGTCGLIFFKHMPFWYMFSDHVALEYMR